MSSDTHSASEDIVLDPSGIGEAVKHGLSPWYIKLRFQDDSIISERAWKEADSPLSALPARTGDEFEQEIYDEVTPHAHTVVESWRDYDSQTENNQRICEAVQDAADRSPDSDPTMMLQTQLAGDVDGFYIAGDADLIIIWPTDPVQIRIFDIKSSWDERTYHQIQIAIYSILFNDILDAYAPHIDYEVDGGVIYRETDRSTLSPDALPSFDVEPRQDDVRRLLADDGPITHAFNTSFDELELPVEDGQTSPYGEVYNTKAIESNDISLLGLSAGEQRILRQNELHTLEDVAELIEPPEKPKPYQFEDPEPRREHRDLVRTLDEQRGLNTRIPVLAQRAQALLGRLNPEHPDAHDKPWTLWIQGSGRANLPEDSPNFDADDLGIEPGSLIRVYLNVQYDYVRDQVAVLSARLDCTNYPGSSFSFSHAIDEIPDEYEDRSPEEALITTFTEDLFRATQTLAELSGQPDDAPVHYYLYTEAERDALVEAAKRHDDTESVHALRDLFGMREGIDQSMVSIVQPEIEQRFALKIPSTGLFQLVTELYPPDEEENAKLVGDNWEYTRESGETIDLRDAFRYDLFDDNRPYVREGSTIKILNGGSDEEPDGFYPALPREGAQFPLEYLWACKEINEFGPDWTSDPQHKSLIERYQWVNSNEKDTRLSVEDIEALGETAAHALHHLERSITYRDIDIQKEALPMSELDSYTLGEGSLAQACREYLDLEHRSAVEDALSQYRQPVKQRILSGRAVPVRIRDVEDHGYMLKAEAELIYGAFTFDNPEQIAKSSRAGGSDGGSSGSWKVATPLELTPTGYTDAASKPEDILHSTPVTIDKFDPTNRTATLKLFRRGSNKYSNRYSSWIRRWTTTEGHNNRRYFGPGEEFILDDASDDMNANKAMVALDYAYNNPAYNLLTDFLHGRKTEATRSSDLFSDIDEYLTWVKENCEFAPNTRQQEFITQRYHKLSLLQGPPGTGKTSGALAHALLGRTYAASLNDHPLRVAVTGASNKSVDEVLGDVAELLDQHDGDGPLGNTKLVRLVLDEPDEPEHENVDYINYNSDDAQAYLRMMYGRLEDPSSGSQSGLDSFTDGESAPQNIMVFGTPGRLQKTMVKLTSGDVEDRYANGERFFDIIAADEASMLPLWQLFMVSAFWNPRGQVLLAGDQRQMPPVQSHEWVDEDRRIIEEFVPYLSSLNYLRFLRGETVQRIADKDIDSPDVDLPMTRLERTYRCHEDVSEFLRRWVYSQDGIDYTSEETDTITPPTGDLTAGVRTALEPDEPISMLLHDDDTSHQSNFVEAQLVKEIVKNVPDTEDVGIVVPHNAQKGLVSALCERESNVDTVERFQGGQKDVIILSATVSDPGFLQDESEFILNPNRLNVALSRMKKKLIVIAPKTLFRLLPQDVTEYSNSIIWKGLYSEVNASASEQWDGSLAEFVGSDSKNTLPNAHVEVYDKRAEPSE